MEEKTSRNKMVYKWYKKNMALQKIKWYMLFGMILKMVSMMDEANEENNWAPKLRECKRNRE